jgi:radical SAM-linked protein
MRTLQRMIRRSGIPVEYSRGFNPHINMSIAQPLSVGIYSTGEYMDLYLKEHIPKGEIVRRLNCSAPEGIRILRACRVKRNENSKTFKSMASISAAEYVIGIEYDDTGKLRENLSVLEKTDHWYDLKKTKKGEHRVDIRKLIKSIKYAVEDNKLTIHTVLCCGSVENLSPQLLAHFIQHNTEDVNVDHFVNIVRKEMYGKIGNKLVPLCEYIKYVQ